MFLNAKAIDDLDTAEYISQMFLGMLDEWGNDGFTRQRAVMNIIAMLKSCATHSILAKKHQSDIQKDLGLPEHGIIQACSTRWNSTLHMLERSPGTEEGS